MEKLLKEIRINGLRAQLGSDHHVPLSAARHYACELIAEQSADVLFLLGDLFQVGDADPSPQINFLIGLLAGHYDDIVYVPGNHCLRGRADPWSSFRFPKNVHYPQRALDTPVVQLGGQRCLIGNLFYDQRFLDPRLLGFTPAQVAGFYRTRVNDGRYFLNGDTALFPQMTARLAAALDRSVDIVATHGLPHPSLITFRVNELTDKLKRLADEIGAPFVADPDDDAACAARYRMSAERFRAEWNFKSFIMGSNALTHPAADFKDGLVALYGHNHRGGTSVRTVRGKTVHFHSHQTTIS